MDQGSKLLSSVIAFLKYAKYLPTASRRESLIETIDRSRQMDLQMFPKLSDEIIDAYTLVDSLTVMPSMRKLQFAGDAILKNHARSYNCSFAHMSHVRVFSESLFLLLSGVGFGYSCQRRHTEQLPVVKWTKETFTFRIPDSIEGWAMAVDALMRAYLDGRPRPEFIFDDIRPKGAYLVTTGAKAPGPDPLRKMLIQVEHMVQQAVGRRLRPIEVHDIMCVISDCVVSGGVRRSAMIALFDRDDEEMLGCKKGEWWTSTPWRARANNSAVLHRAHATYEDFMRVFHACRDSKAGEPGFFWTNDYELGTNPCAEIGLMTDQFCNLTSMNMTKIQSGADFALACRAAAFLGTLQSAYTDFHYLDPSWRRTTEKEALLGVSMTGVADAWNTFGFQPSKLINGADLIRRVNEETAAKIGVNPAARLTCLKPEGTLSCIVQSSSGVHDRHAQRYVRNVRIQKSEPLYEYLKLVVPALVSDDVSDPLGAILSVPIESPEGSILRSDSTAQSMFARACHLNQFWVRMGHVSGANTHNTSVTISVKDDEWDGLGEQLWTNRQMYAGISLLPFDGGSYVQAPFEEVSDEKFADLQAKVASVDLTKVVEDTDNTARSEQSACEGGLCLPKYMR